MCCCCLFGTSLPPRLSVQDKQTQGKLEQVALRTTGVTGHRLHLVQCPTSVPSGKKKKGGGCQMAKRLLSRLRSTLGRHFMRGTSLPPELRLQATCHPRSSRSLSHVQEVAVPPVAAGCGGAVQCRRLMVHSGEPTAGF